jgi:tetratricopeptide (TPR) repeat protein
MAKRFFIVAFIFSLLMLVGCTEPDSGVSRVMPPRTSPMLGTGRPVNLTEAGEIDIVEKVATSRQAYREGLERLVRYYTKTGNNEKLDWASKEMKALNVMPQYDYIVPVVTPKVYRATTSIPDADLIYEDARLQKNQAEKYSLALVNKDLYRMALRKFDDLIKKYPSSDKIDDSAYMAGAISEYFKDYSIALDYYQCAYTWDPDTPHPARFKAARILDKYMHRNAEALALYIKAVEIEGRYGKYRELKNNAEERIEDLQKSGQGQP